MTYAHMTFLLDHRYEKEDKLHKTCNQNFQVLL